MPWDRAPSLQISTAAATPTVSRSGLKHIRKRALAVTPLSGPYFGRRLRRVGSRSSVELKAVKAVKAVKAGGVMGGGSVADASILRLNVIEELGQV